MQLKIENKEKAKRHKNIKHKIDGKYKNQSINHEIKVRSLTTLLKWKHSPIVPQIQILLHASYKKRKKWCEIKEWVKIFQASTKQGSTEMTILNSEKVLFQAKSIQQNMKCHFLFIKIIIHN